MLSCNSLNCVHPYMRHIYGRGVCIFVLGSSGRHAESTCIPGLLCVFAPSMTFVFALFLLFLYDFNLFQHMSACPRDVCCLVAYSLAYIHLCVI